MCFFFVLFSFNTCNCGLDDIVSVFIHAIYPTTLGPCLRLLGYLVQFIRARKNILRYLKAGKNQWFLSKNGFFDVIYWEGKVIPVRLKFVGTYKMHILLGSCGTLIKNGFLGVVSILGLLYNPNFDFLPLTSACMLWADTV